MRLLIPLFLAIFLLPTPFLADVKGYNCAWAAFMKGFSHSGDYAEAVKWYRKAADLGDDQAPIFLGDMYVSGKGVKQDWAEAYFWHRVSGYDDGNPLADLREKEDVKHLTPDQIRAVDKRFREWWLRAAE